MTTDAATVPAAGRVARRNAFREGLRQGRLVPIRREMPGTEPGAALPARTAFRDFRACCPGRR